ncbi:UNKNOWN [Stylonychia lemnae]|uniref:C2 NT-type domain-containing protein n=1 Tax=Stylonychia lemnae TaxID=5949 RepID=A0A078A4W8_STYLE|nr:UNKNOWN [Stylonychia lemnae]|eukprot:CDW77239.1 UNKNOWN [Stylonychia lemnae]
MSYSSQNFKELIIKDHNSLIFVDKKDQITPQERSIDSAPMNSNQNQILKCQTNTQMQNQKPRYIPELTGKSQTFVATSIQDTSTVGNSSKNSEQFSTLSRPIINRRDVKLKSPSQQQKTNTSNRSLTSSINDHNEESSRTNNKIGFGLRHHHQNSQQENQSQNFPDPVIQNSLIFKDNCAKSNKNSHRPNTAAIDTTSLKLADNQVQHSSHQISQQVIQTNLNPSNLQLLLTVHEVSISIPGSINLIISSVCNDFKYDTPKRRKVDTNSQTVNFSDQELAINLTAGQQQQQVLRENQSISVKLLAVSDTKSKLIGLYQMKLNLKEFQQFKNQKFMFDKCIDKQAFLIISASLKGNYSNLYQNQISSSRQIQDLQSMFNDGNQQSNQLAFNSRNDKQNNMLNNSNSKSYSVIESKQMNSTQSIQIKNLPRYQPVNTQTPIPERNQTSSSQNDYFMTSVKNNDKSRLMLHNSIKSSGLNDSRSIDRDFTAMDEDECNLINKDDFEEGKQKDIVTARATPIKSNALARKNLSTARKLTHNIQSPDMRNPYQFQEPQVQSTTNGVYLQIINGAMGLGQKLMSQTYNLASTEQSFINTNNPQVKETNSIESDALITERRDVNSFNDNISSNMNAYNQAQAQLFANQNSNPGSRQSNAPAVYLRQTPVKQNKNAKQKPNQKSGSVNVQQKPPQTPSSFQQICESIYSLRLGGLQFTSESKQQNTQEKKTPRDRSLNEEENVQQQLQIQELQRKLQISESLVQQLEQEVRVIKQEKIFVKEKDQQQKDDLMRLLKQEQDKAQLFQKQRDQLDLDYQTLQQELALKSQQLQNNSKNQSSLISTQNSSNAQMIVLQQQNEQLLHQLEEFQLKFNRSKQVSEFFETKNQDSQKEIEVCKAQISQNFKQIQTKEQELQHEQRLNQEINEKLSKMERDQNEQREDWNRKRRDLQKELDFLMNEQNQKEFELSEVKDKLRKREDELRDLKLNLNNQIGTVYEQYKEQIEELTKSNESLKQELEQIKEKYSLENKKRIAMEDERQDLVERYERQREMMKENAKELIDIQSQVANFEEKLMTTEQQLIQAKASWAESEHEKAQLYNECQENLEKIQDLEEKLSKQEQIERGRRHNSAATTKTSSSCKSNNNMHIYQ